MQQPLEEPICKFAIVKMVHIDDADTKRVTFSTRSSTLEREQFVVDLAEILVSPPTDAPDPVTHAPGNVGPLYLSKDGWKVAARSGATLYQAGSRYVLFKWPRCLPYRLLANLDVKPTAIVVDGTDPATGKPVVIDLCSADAAPAQSLAWTGAMPVTVALSNGSSLAIWPKQIRVTAASLRKPHKSATVDILDVEFADFVQTLAWSSPSDPVTLRLSTSGFGKFKVAPDMMQLFAHGAQVSYPDAMVREAGDLDGVDEDDVRAVVEAVRARFAGIR